MQMGIISFKAVENKKVSHITMGLIDYKTEYDTPAVSISWTKDDKDAWSNPIMHIASEDVARLSEIGRVALAVDKLKAKHKNAVKDPATLIHLLQKQLGRHVYHTGNEWEIVPKDSKENQWTDPVLALKVTAGDEETAKTKLMKALGVAMADNMDKMDDYATWMKAGCKVKELKTTIDNIVSLLVYSRTGKKEAQDA